MKSFSIKLGSMFIVTIIIAVIFAGIYSSISKLNFIDSMYKSFSIQTIGGNQLDPKNDVEKMLISLQSFIAFMIISGLIIISIE